MTTDAFTEAARAEAERRNPSNAPKGLTRASNAISRRDFRDGAEWARAHLAQQEPTDAEVLAALNADYAIRFGPRNFPADSLEPYGDEAVRIMRAALTAAKEGRHATDE